MGGLSTLTGQGSSIQGGDAGPATTGPTRGGDLALGGINIGMQGGLNPVLILALAALAIGGFVLLRK